jgi:hypothetical protein
MLLVCCLVAPPSPFIKHAFLSDGFIDIVPPESKVKGNPLLFIEIFRQEIASFNQLKREMAFSKRLYQSVSFYE